MMISFPVSDDQFHADADRGLPGPPGDLPRAFGAPAATGRIRRRPDHFQVEERLGFEPSGDGPHQLLRVEKTGCNTADAAAMIAAHAGVAARDVGYSGQKDRHAVCIQWFSVPFSPEVDWTALDGAGLRVLDTGRHRRKLKRGAHRANRFDITVVLNAPDAAALERRLAQVRQYGVPNYFGEQRFGRRYADNARRLAAGERLSRFQRGMTLSAMRAGLFNQVLAARVGRGDWNRALPGEYLNLDGTRSGFAAEPDDPDIAPRIAALDLHPTGPLYGAGDNPAAGEAARLEEEVLGPFDAWRPALERHGLKMERRATRCIVRDFDWQLDEARGLLRLRFTLRRGEFATAVLRELVDYRDVTRGEEGSPPGASDA